MQKEDVSFENIKRIATMMDDHDSVGVTRKLNGGKCVFDSLASPEADNPQSLVNN
jgi:hypothetical protein